MRKTKRALAIALSAVMLMQPFTNVGASKAYAAGTDVTIDATTFPNGLFRNYVSKEYDTDQNGVLSADEIAGATELVLDQTSYGSVDDLTGIENLTALEMVSCRGLKLNALDVSALVKLTYLDCGKNRIEELNIDKNTELIALYCDSNKISILDTRNNGKLLYLECSNNTAIRELAVVNSPQLKVLRFANTAITDIAINTLKNLTILDCSGTAMAELDLANSPDLEYLFCDDMTALNKLDISGYPNLLGVSCGGGSITELDASNNPKLQALVCGGKTYWTGALEEVEASDGQEAVTVVKQFTQAGPSSLSSLNITGDSALMVLDCSYNKLKSLDVSPYTNLTYLDVSGNGMTDESGLSVKANTALQVFNCASNQFTTIDISANKALKRFDCDGNLLTYLDLSQNSLLKDLSCGNNQLTSLDVTTCDPDIAVACSGNTYTITLDEKYEYDMGSLKGFVQANKYDEKNEAGKALLKSIGGGAVINSYVLLPELNAEKVTYSYFYGKMAAATNFTLKITNPLKVTVLINKGQPDESTVTGSSSFSVAKGKSVMLTAIHSDTENLLPDFTWSSGNDKVATVDTKTGELTAVAAGETQIFGIINGYTRCYVNLTVTEPVTDIQLDTHALTLENGGENNSHTFAPTILPEDATNKTVTYESSDPKVAKVTNKGVVSAMGAGTATITCKAADGSEVYDECLVTVVQKVTYLSLPGNSRYMTVGEEDTIVPVVQPENAADLSVTWESDNTSVLTVTEKGVVKAIAPGVANLTCTSVDNPKCKSVCTVTVLAANSAVQLNAPSCDLILGTADGNDRRFQLEATVTDDSIENPIFTWESADPTIAGVNGKGLVTAAKAGKTVIRCKIGSAVVATCDVNVTQRVTKLAVTLPVKSLFIGDTAIATPVITPENASNQEVTWSTSDETIATVSSTGVVTAKAVGTVDIICKATDGSEIQGIYNLTVTKPVEKIKLDSKSVSLFVGARVSAGATALPEDATNRDMIYESSDQTIAYVSRGLIQGVKKGTATITCTAKDGSGVVAVIEVKVKQPVTSITFDCNTVVIKKGKTYTLKPKIGPSNASSKSVKWTTSDKKIATVSSSGKVTAKKAGVVNITCTAKDGSNKYAVCKVIVGNPITKVKLNKTSTSVKKGKTITLKATVSPTSASYPYVTWKSSNEKYATVSNGVVTGIKKGTATITCTAADGSKKKTTCKVKVK